MTPILKLRTLPVIDISPWVLPESAKHRGHCGGRASTAAALHSACLTYGFFYLDISSYVEQGEMEELTRLAKQFFSLPNDVKETLGLENQDGARGYQRLRENITMGKADNHEGLDFYAPVPNPDKTKPLWGENQWPTDDIATGFREKYERWVEKMKQLGMVVMEAMSVGLGMSREEWLELRSKVDDSFWVMRVIGYPPLPNNYDGFSCGAHKDYGCLTLLYADPTPNALQVFVSQREVLDDAALAPVSASNTSGLAPSAASAVLAQETIKEGDSSDGIPELPKEEGDMPGVWISADPLPGCIVCNIGEMWEIWTNGMYKSTLHRVVHRGSNYRVSVPFFFEPNFDALVEPLPAALRLQKDTIQPAYASHRPSRKSSAVDLTLNAGSHSNSNLVSGYTNSDTLSPNLAAALAQATSVAVTPTHPGSATVLSPLKTYEPVVYGEFLTKKVGGNFVTGKGRYDDDD